MAHRYVCSVLEEMRACDKNKNYSCLLSQIEEVQVLVNRMEASLSEKNSLEHWHDKAKKEKCEYNRLLEKTNELRKKAGEKEEKKSNYYD